MATFGPVSECGEIYLDNNATTMPFAEVAEVTARTMSEMYGNPSSPHRRGEIARQALFDARRQVAKLVGCEEEAIIFTSGGTEANNLVIKSLCRIGKNPRLITSAVEHSSVLKVADTLRHKGVLTEILAVDAKGKISPEKLAKSLEKPASLVSIQWANSETGTLQQIETLGEICKRHKVPFHVDAAQVVGRLSVNMKQLPINFLSFTAHKMHGPQGVGAIATKEREGLEPIFHGGDQEGGFRPGTENLPGIAGFGLAAHMRGKSLDLCVAKLRKLRDIFESDILAAVPESRVNGDTKNRVANSSNIHFPGVDGTAMMALLDSEGICCSLTSACVSARPEPSHVLMAMGLSEQEAYSSIRFSFSILNTESEARTAATKISDIYYRLLDLELPLSEKA